MEKKMKFQIPRVIHYFWFGGGEKPDSVKKCIASWRKNCPDFEIKEWNESNYDSHKHPYMEKAYSEKMWAFVSDYARLDILYQYGGIYLDTDVEVIKDLSPLCELKAFIGFERSEVVNDGQGFGCMAGISVFKEMLQCYEGSEPYCYIDGKQCYIESPRLRTKVLLRHGLLLNGTRQTVAGIEVLPADYLCPLNLATGKMKITDNTYSIHYFDASWQNGNGQKYRKLMQLLNVFLGIDKGLACFGKIMRTKDAFKDLFTGTRHVYHYLNDNIEYALRGLLRVKENNVNRRRLSNQDFSVISSNCVGAVILHELNQRFNSPTVNMYFEPDDYIKFLKNIDHYLACDLVNLPYESSLMGYPVGGCDDIKLHLVHYKSVDEANKKWKERSKRVNKDNLFIIMVDRDGCTDLIRQEFDKLPYKNKAFLSYTNHDDISCNVVIPNSRESTPDGDQTTDLCRFQPGFTGLRLFDEWDYVSFFNKGLSQ